MSPTFTTIVFQPEGMNATGLPVPDEVVAALGSSRNPPVRVTVRRGASSGTYSYTSTVATRNGRSIISLSAAHRTAAGVTAGDEVEVALELDDQPRKMMIPDDLGAALGSAGVLDAFVALSYSKQRAHIDPVDAAKTEETRQRRIAKVVESLVGPAQPRVSGT